MHESKITVLGLTHTDRGEHYLDLEVTGGHAFVGFVTISGPTIRLSSDEYEQLSKAVAAHQEALHVLETYRIKEDTCCPKPD